MDEYILVIPAQHGAALVQAAERFGTTKAAHNPTDIQAVTREAGPPSVVLVSSFLPNLAQNLSSLRRLFPSSRLLVAGTVLPLQLAGLDADDIVRFPFPEDFTLDGGDSFYQAIRETVTPAVPLSEKTPRSAGRERVVLITSGKGGEGKTTVTMQLAVLLAKNKVSVLVIDADYSGNAHEWLQDNSPVQTLGALDRDREWDRAALDALLLERKGVKVLPHAEVVPPDLLERAIRSYRPYYSVILVDMHQGVTPQLIKAKDFATHILILTTPAERRLSGIRIIVSKLLEYGTPRQVLRVIVNEVRNDDDSARVRVALEDYRLAFLSLPYQENLARDDDPDFVPVSNASTKDPYPAAFRRMAAKAIDWEWEQGTEKPRPSTASKNKKASESFWTSLFGSKQAKKPKRK